MFLAPVAFRSALFVLTVGLTLGVAGVASAAPTASFTFSPAAPHTGDVVTFQSTSTDVIEPQLWDLNGDGAFDDASGPSAKRTFEAAGTYTIGLRVTNGTDVSTVSRKVTILNRPPVAVFTYAPVTPLTGDQVLFTSASTDPDGPIAGLGWDLDNDGAFDDGNGPTASLSFAAAGLYTVRLLAVDRDGGASVTFQVITVAERLAQLLGPFPVVRVIGRATGRGARIREVIVKAPAGSTVRIRCNGRGCPFRTLTRTAALRTGSVQGAATRVLRIRRFRHRTLRAGAAVRIWVTKPGRIGKYTRFRVRRGKPPKRVDRCVPPGTTRPAPCPTS